MLVDTWDQNQSYYDGDEAKHTDALEWMRQQPGNKHVDHSSLRWMTYSRPRISPEIEQCHA